MIIIIACSNSFGTDTSNGESVHRFLRGRPRGRLDIFVSSSACLRGYPRGCLGRFEWGKDALRGPPGRLGLIKGIGATLYVNNSKYNPTLKRNGNPVVGMWTDWVSHFAIILATDFEDQLKGWACIFDSVTKAINRSARWSKLEKSLIRSRLRCRMLNRCSTWFIHKQCTGVKEQTKRGWASSQAWTCFPLCIFRLSSIRYARVVAGWSSCSNWERNAMNSLCSIWLDLKLIAFRPVVMLSGHGGALRGEVALLCQYYFNLGCEYIIQGINVNH